jgi:hypothetical protein
MEWHTINSALQTTKGLIGQYGGIIAAVLVLLMAVMVGALPKGKP